MAEGRLTSTGVEVGDLEAPLEQLDTRDETGPLDAVLVELIWMTAVIGGSEAQSQALLHCRSTHLEVMTHTTP